MASPSVASQPRVAAHNYQYWSRSRHGLYQVITEVLTDGGSKLRFLGGEPRFPLIHRYLLPLRVPPFVLSSYE